MISATPLQIGYSGRLLFSTDALELKTSSFTVLAGRNGCGKSTMIRTLTGLHKPLSGEVMLNKVNIRSLKPIQKARQFSMVLTGRVNNAYLSVFDVLMLARFPYAPLWRKLPDDDLAIVLNAADRCSISDKLHRSVNYLSDGEYQRVMIARALAQDTPMIVLDEPVAHLDPMARKQIFQLLWELVTTENKTILAATHAIDLALEFAGELWLINKDNQFSTCMAHEANPERLFSDLYAE